MLEIQYGKANVLVGRFFKPCIQPILINYEACHALAIQAVDPDYMIDKTSEAKFQPNESDM